VSDAVRKKQGGRALFDEIGGIAPEEAGVDKSLRNVERGCQMDVSVFHSGAASLDGRSLRLEHERVQVSLFRTEISGHWICSRHVAVVATVLRPGINQHELASA